MPLPPDPFDPLQAFLVGLETSDAGLQATALRKLAWLRHEDGRNTDALRTMRVAAERAAEAGVADLGHALVDLARLLLRLRRPAVAEVAARNAAESLRRARDLPGAAGAQSLRAEALAAAGHPWMAEAACLDAFEVWRELGDERRAAASAIAAARIASQRGDRERALDWLLQAVPAVRGEHGDAASWARGELGALLFQRAEEPAAAALLEQAAAEDRVAGRHERAARRLHMLGRAHAAAGRLSASRRALGSAVESWREARNAAGEAATMAALSELLAAHQRPVDAARAAERAIDLAARIDFAPAAERAAAVLLVLPGLDAVTRARCARLLRDAGWRATALALEPAPAP